MADRQTTEDLLERWGTRLDLQWIAGRGGADGPMRLPTDEETPLAGFHNPFRQHVVPVLGEQELNRIGALDERERQVMVSGIFDPPTLMVVLLGRTKPTPEFITESERKNIPLLRSGLSGRLFIARACQALQQTFARSATIHGVFMEVLGTGILITGASGIGKSELALSLLSRSHRLIADDAPDFKAEGADRLWGRCPEAVQDFLEVRGLGIVNIRALYGDSAMCAGHDLELVLHLASIDTLEMQDGDRVHGIHRKREILGVEIPETVVPVGPGRNLAILVECAVRNHLLKRKGIDASEQFVQQQQRLLEKSVS